MGGEGADRDGDSAAIAATEAARVLCSSLAECIYACGFAAAVAPDAPSRVGASADVARALDAILGAARAAHDCDVPAVAAAVATIRELLRVDCRDEGHVPAVGCALAELVRAIGARPPLDVMTFVAMVGAVKRGHAGGAIPGLSAARPDRLTGLPARAALCATVEAALVALGRPIRALFVDVDGFQRVNAVHGHPVGDDQLARIGRWIAARVEDIHGSTFRVGGEEFVVLLPSSDPAEAAAALQAIVEECTALRLDDDPATDGRAFTSLSGFTFLLGALSEAEVPDVLEGLRDVLYRERLAAGRGYGVSARLDAHRVGRSDGGAVQLGAAPDGASRRR